MQNLPEWQLPAGVTRSLWEYAHAEHIADDYDEYFAYNKLFEYDEAILLEHLSRPGTVVDLGCGTGRLLLPLARRGFRCIAVDLSAEMLRVVDNKADAAGVNIERVQANLVELGCFADRSVDYALLMFSTLGMVRHDRCRRRALAHVRRMLRPGGRFVCHVHNRWYNARDPQGRRWLIHNAWQALTRRGIELGDKVYDYRGIPNMFIHVFTAREFRRLLRGAGFEIERWIPLDTDRQRPLPGARWLGDFRANGWIAICR